MNSLVGNKDSLLAVNPLDKGRPANPYILFHLSQ